MRLPEIAVKNPVFTIMVFIAILLFGLVSMTMIPKDVLPDIELPSLTVITVYPGASATEVESQITKTLEKILSGATGLKSIKSGSKENVSIITLEFNWGTQLNDASNTVRDLMELVKTDLPQEARAPIIMKISSSMLPIVAYSVEATDSYNGLDKLVEDRISSPIKKVPGVGTTLVLGQPEREIRVECDPYQLAAYHMSVSQVAQALATQNLSIPAGNIKLGKASIAVRVPAEFKSVEEISQTPIYSINNQVVKIQDVAKVNDTFKEKEAYLRSSGKKAVLLLVQKQSGTNTLSVAQAVMKTVSKIQKSLPPDVKITEVMNSSELVSESVSNLSTTIFYAAIFVILVVLFFLRELRSSVIIILTIPFSLIIAFSYMFIARFTINIFSLMSLAIAIGMVVDNAIVVLENITRHIELGEKPREASIFGASEMGLAITGSTLTTIAVFIPMVFMGGLVGILFKQLAILTSITLIASLFTALTLTPMLASRWIKPKTRQATKPHGKLFQLSERWFTKVENLYDSVLSWALSNRKKVIVIALILFISSIIAIKFIGTDYIPNIDAGDLNAVIELDKSVSPEETYRVAQEVEAIFLKEVPELRSMYSITGQSEKGLLSTIGFKEGRNISSIGTKLVLPDQRKRSAKEIERVLRKRIAEIPEIEKFRVVGGSLMQSAMLGNAKPVEIKITGNDMDLLNKTANDLYMKLRKKPHLVNLETTVDNGIPELQVNIDKQKASALGINPALAAVSIRQSIYGAASTQYKDNGDLYDIVVKLAPEYRNDVNALNAVPLNSLNGTVVPLSAIANISEGFAPMQIDHESQQRIVRITGELEGISLGKAVSYVQDTVRKTEVPAGVDVALGGQHSDQQSSFKSLLLMFVLGIIMVYMVMASLFGAFRDPFIIMMAVPLAVIGVIWAFLITGVTLSVISFIGVVMLLGIVVNNGIVLVDYTNLLRGRGQSLVTAVHNAGKSRMRPVLMTAFTTIFGMVPMAVSKGLGSEIWSPLGITCIGGLVVSTLITLILIPVLYASLNRKQIQGE
jgi:HAE1 family hydrophobic/amphiphilic exporter-1